MSNPTFKPSAKLSSSGQRRRESMLDELLDSMDGIQAHRRRRRRVALAAVGCVVLLLGASALLAPMWSGLPASTDLRDDQVAVGPHGSEAFQFAERVKSTPGPESTSARGLVQRVSRPQSSITVKAVRTAEVRPVHSQALTDASLVSTLEELGHSSAGIIKVGTTPAYVTGVSLTALQEVESQDSSKGEPENSDIRVQLIEA